MLLNSDLSLLALQSKVHCDKMSGDLTDLAVNISANNNTGQHGGCVNTVTTETARASSDCAVRFPYTDTQNGLTLWMTRNEHRNNMVLSTYGITHRQMECRHMS